MSQLNQRSSTDLELLNFDTCPYCRRVRDHMDRLGVKGVRLRDIHTEAGAANELVARGGKLQVPALFIDGVPLYESAEIIDWLDVWAESAAAA